MKTPARLVGIGRGGSKIVYRLMQQEWILEEVISEGETGRDYIRATTIDSAVTDEFHDEQYGRATDTIESVIEDSDVREGSGHIEFPEPKIVPELVGDRWRNPDELVSDVIPDLMDDQDLNSWWLKKGQDPLKKIETAGMSGGVSRRRAFSKVLHHIAEFTDNSLTHRPIQHLDQDDDEAYFIAALGGGTGSGMVLDLAKETDAEVKHLFAVIPHEREQGSERANAWAALSELEYAHLSGESPFETITLMPFHPEMEQTEEDFEMAVVRSILAHQNGINGGNLTQRLPPGSDDGPPSFAPFTLAVPYTILYDIKAREDAEEGIDTFLTSKEDELEKETDLYNVVLKFLSRGFSRRLYEKLETVQANREYEHIGIEFKSKYSDAAGKEALRLKERLLGSIQDTLLTQSAFEIAGIGDYSDAIRTAMEETLDDNINLGGATTDEEEAIIILNHINRFQGKIHEKFEDVSSGGGVPDTAERLLEVVQQELENIKRRWTIWAATEEIKQQEDTNLEGEEKQMAIRVIREAVLDDETVYLDTKIGGYEKLINELESQKELRADQKARFSDHINTIEKDLRERVQKWRNSVVSEAETLSMIHAHEDHAKDAIESYIGKVNNALETLDTGPDTGTQARGVSIETSIDVDGKDASGVEALNSLLDNILLDTVDKRRINYEKVAKEFEKVREARAHYLEHSGGLLGPDREEEFTTAVSNTGTYFDIQPEEEVPRVDAPWGCSFNDGKVRRDSQIAKSNTDAKERITEKFVNKYFSDDQSNIVQFSLSAETEFDDIVVPQDLTLSDFQSIVSDELTSLLNNSVDMDQPDEVSGVRSGDIQDILTDELRNPEAESAAVRALHNSYIRPYQEKKDEYDTEISRIVTENKNSDADKVGYGALEILEKLKGISDGEEETNQGVELPKVHRGDIKEETYGQDFSRGYTGEYVVEFEREGGAEVNDHPYLATEKADSEDVLNEPAHIGESDVLESDHDVIATIFSNSLNRISRDQRIPLVNLNPRGSGNVGSAESGIFRFSPVYLSQGFSTNVNPSKYEAVESVISQSGNVDGENEYYQAAQYHGGKPDEITMVMFIGGVFTDNLSLAVEKGGYRESYLRRYPESDFAGQYHSVGLGGRWKYWPEMQEHARDDENYPNVGVYVHRKETGDVDDKSFIDRILQGLRQDDEDPKDVFREMHEFDSYESSVEPN